MEARPVCGNGRATGAGVSLLALLRAHRRVKELDLEGLAGVEAFIWVCLLKGTPPKRVVSCWQGYPQKNGSNQFCVSSGFLPSIS